MAKEVNNESCQPSQSCSPSGGKQTPSCWQLYKYVRITQEDSSINYSRKQYKQVVFLSLADSGIEYYI